MTRILLLSLFFLCSHTLLSQQVNTIKNRGQKNADSVLLKKNRNVYNDSVVILKLTCKNLFIYSVRYNTSNQPDILPPYEKEIKKTAFLTVHGNVLYNFSYRSYIDTPFAESNVMQHLVQTNFNLLIKGKYPLKMTLSNRSSNSPYFKNATDVNLEFNRYQLLDNIKNTLRNKVGTAINNDELMKAEQLYKNKISQSRELQEWLDNPARIQEMVEEKERLLAGNIPARTAQEGYTDINKTVAASLEKELAAPLLNETKGKEQGVWKKIQSSKTLSKNDIRETAEKNVSVLKDTLTATTHNKVKQKDSTVAEKISSRKQELEKIKTTLKEQQAGMMKKKKTVQDSIALLKQEINSLNSGAGLYAFMKKNHIKDSLTKGQKLLLSINKIGIGRTWIDYSELTVKNVSLSGVNIEMNPANFYVAFAAGKLNYRFRDFILKNNTTLPDQSLYLVRTGLGQKEKNNLVFTFYNGKKQELNNASAASPNAIQKILGVSAEARLALNENNYVIAELAKSSFNTSSTVQPAQSDLLDKAFNWKIHSNEAYSIKLFSQYPQTDTRITAYYRKTGENFQSFNLYPIGSNQEAWMGKVNQSFWKRKLILDMAVRKNDFESPVAAAAFASKTIFKSFQATLRIPKYPFISAGYYPSSQLSISNNNVLTENQYNTLNGIVNYSYSVRDIAMNTNAVYTKFYNKGSDSGFIYFNASSYTINHSIFLNPLVLQSSVGITDQKNLYLLTLEELVSYQFANKLTLSGSLKWNRLNRSVTLLGGTASLGLYLRKLGTIQFNYDKTYLPGYNRVLMPVDIGRMSFYRSF